AQGKAPARPTKEEAKGLLRQGRTLLAQGKVDEAAQAALKVKAMTHLSWGLFEDSPDQLQRDAAKARVERDRQESVKVRAEARRLSDKGTYEAASKPAYRAEKLHGPYSIWDLGDRPSKVIADVQTAQAKARRTPLPPPVLAKGPAAKPGTQTTDTRPAAAK